MLRLATGSRLELECKSSCGPATSTFEWVKSGSREEASTLEADDYGLVIESATYEDGGIYKCRCLPDGPQCEHSVYSKPHGTLGCLHGKIPLFETKKLLAARDYTPNYRCLVGWLACTTKF